MRVILRRPFKHLRNRLYVIATWLEMRLCFIRNTLSSFKLAQSGDKENFSKVKKAETTMRYAFNIDCQSYEMVLFQYTGCLLHHWLNLVERRKRSHAIFKSKYVICDLFFSNIN